MKFKPKRQEKKMNQIVLCALLDMMLIKIRSGIIKTWMPIMLLHGQREDPLQRIIVRCYVRLIIKPREIDNEEIRFT